MNEGFRTLLVEVTNSGTSQEPEVSLIHITRVDFFFSLINLIDSILEQYQFRIKETFLNNKNQIETAMFVVIMQMVSISMFQGNFMIFVVAHFQFTFEPVSKAS